MKLKLLAFAVLFGVLMLWESSINQREEKMDRVQQCIYKYGADDGTCDSCYHAEFGADDFNCGMCYEE